MFFFFLRGRKHTGEPGSVMDEIEAEDPIMSSECSGELSSMSDELL